MRARQFLIACLGAASALVVVVVLWRARARRQAALERRQRDGLSVVLGGVIGLLGAAVVRGRTRRASLERSTSPRRASAARVAKPSSEDPLIVHERGTQLETRVTELEGYITSNDRFYIRSHSPTPRIDGRAWRLRIDGDAVRTPLVLDYDELRRMPQLTITRALCCAGDGRRFFKHTFGVAAEGAQWGTGAIGVAAWSGVRLRDLLKRAGVSARARDVMPEGLDKTRLRRPIPLSKAMADDTLLALEMNGEPLPPDHGFPARVIVSGWAGIASIKWVGRIQVSEEPLYTPWNTVDYVLIGPEYAPVAPALGPPITEMPVMSLLELDWPAIMPAGHHTVRGRSFAGEARVREVVWSVDGGPWRDAQLFGPDIQASWRRWCFEWDAEPGHHEIRVRAIDERGRSQPDRVPWNDLGYLYNAVVAHPIEVSTLSGPSRIPPLATPPRIGARQRRSRSPA